MKNKTEVYASGGNVSGSLESGYTTGMIPNTVAKAQDVNLYMRMSDEELMSVCTELKNLLLDYGVTLSAADNTQIKTLFDTLFKSNFAVTGVDKSSFTAAPTQSGNSISFPAFKIIFNTDTYYGNTKSQHTTVSVSAQTLAATSGWFDGVHYIYADSTGTLGHTQLKSDIDGSQNSKCFLGSVFVINGAFQAGSWCYEPWLQITTAESRENGLSYVKGGYVSPASATTLQIGDYQIVAEGINFGTNQNSPNMTPVTTGGSFTYKFLYPDYDPSQSALTTLDTTHIYNTTAGTWDDISSLATGNPHFIVLVPCIAPTGQTLMIPAMSSKAGTTYAQIFDTIEDATNAIFGLQYSLEGVADRVIYLGQSIVVKVGATDLTDAQQCITVGMLPQALATFTSASGQTGGSIATYRPMPSVTWDGYTNVTCQNNAANVIVDDGLRTVNVSMPTPTSSIVNQLEVHYSCIGGSLTWTTQINWWTGTAPAFVSGKTYNIIFEYINGSWFGGVLAVGV